MFESRLFFSGHIARLWLARRAGTVLCPSGNRARAADSRVCSSGTCSGTWSQWLGLGRAFGLGR